MAGSYVEGESKTFSGLYSLIKAAVNVSQGNRGVVAYPFTGNWGPINLLMVLLYQPEFEKLYGTALTAGKINTHAFKAKPSRVLAYRMATGLAAKGNATLDD